jgi:hypothetical protein
MYSSMLFLIFCEQVQNTHASGPLHLLSSSASKDLSDIQITCSPKTGLFQLLNILSFPFTFCSLYSDAFVFIDCIIPT